MGKIIRGERPVEKTRQASPGAGNSPLLFLRNFPDPEGDHRMRQQGTRSAYGRAAVQHPDLIHNNQGHSSDAHERRRGPLAALNHAYSPAASSDFPTALRRRKNIQYPVRCDLRRNILVSRPVGPRPAQIRDGRVEPGQNVIR